MDKSKFQALVFQHNHAQFKKGQIVWGYLNSGKSKCWWFCIDDKLLKEPTSALPLYRTEFDLLKPIIEVRDEKIDIIIS